MTALEGLEILMQTLGHFYKVLDEQTIMILQNTPANRQAYEDRIIQTFYLSNSDVKDVMTILRSLLATRFIAANERLNAIVMLDSVEKVKVAERIIEQSDKAKAEVVIDVELLEIKHHETPESGPFAGREHPRHQPRHRRRGRAAQDVGRRIAESEQLGAQRARFPVRLREEIDRRADAGQAASADHGRRRELVLDRRPGSRSR